MPYRKIEKDGKHHAPRLMKFFLPYANTLIK